MSAEPSAGSSIEPTGPDDDKPGTVEQGGDEYSDEYSDEYEEYLVSLVVTMRVRASSEVAAKFQAREWLARAVRAAAAASVEEAAASAGPPPSAEPWGVDVATPGDMARGEHAYSLTAQERKLRAEAEAVRRLPGRARVVARLAAASTVEEYLAAGEELGRWLKRHGRDEPWHTSLGGVGRRLETLGEALRWAESRPGGRPGAWNLGELLASVKAGVAAEVQESRRAGVLPPAEEGPADKPRGEVHGPSSGRE